MAMRCANCGKGVLHGHNVSHSKRRTVKVFKPNLHMARITINGISVRKKLCTKCLRTVKALTKPVKPTETVVVASSQTSSTA